MSHDGFPSLMALRAESPAVQVGTSPHYSWGRVYGGLVVAQGLRAALATVEPRYTVHSLHAYFILGGNQDEPIRYEVDPLRDGRSFATRRVVARQSAGPILELSASFHQHEHEAEVSLLDMPKGLPAPEALAPQYRDFLDCRVVPRPSAPPGHVTAWIRVPDCPADDPILQACALAYASDQMPTFAVVVAHPQSPAGPATDDPATPDAFFTASLDHALWFHRPPRAHEWMLHDLACHRLGGARGLSIARLWSREGEHVATLTQESLLRVSR